MIETSKWWRKVKTLSGVPKMILLHSSICDSGTHYQISIDHSVRHLLTQDSANAIREALKFSKPVKFRADFIVETPYAYSQSEEYQEKKRAYEECLTDVKIQDILTSFNAKIIGIEVYEH